MTDRPDAAAPKDIECYLCNTGARGTWMCARHQREITSMFSVAATPSRHESLSGQQGPAGNVTAAHGGPPSDAAPVTLTLPLVEELAVVLHEAWRETELGGDCFAGMAEAVVKLYAHPEDAPEPLEIRPSQILMLAKALGNAPEIPMADQDELKDIARYEDEAVTMNEWERMKAVEYWQNSDMPPLTCGNDSNHQRLSPALANGFAVVVCLNCDYTQDAIPDVVFSHYFYAHPEDAPPVETDLLTPEKVREMQKEAELLAPVVEEFCESHGKTDAPQVARLCRDYLTLLAEKRPDIKDAPESPVPPGGPSVEQIAKILCCGHHHTMRGYRGPMRKAKDLPCDRCLFWAVDVRDALNREVGIAHCWSCDVELNVSELFVVPCERCSAKPGSPCRTPNGTKRKTPHALRQTAFVDRLKGGTDG